MTLKAVSFGFLALVISGGTFAETVDLKCKLTTDKDNKEIEAWIAVDAGANLMRVQGVASPLVMTNEAYTSTQRGSVMSTVTSINRETGSIGQAFLYEGQVVPYSKGTCEKAAPPQTKF